MLTNRTPEAHANAVAQFKSIRSEGLFIPFSVGKQTIIFPGFDGGAEWGGSAFDAKTGVIYVNANDVPWTGSLMETKTGGGAGSIVYQSQCALCHGSDRTGSPPAFPSLIDVQKHMTDAQITEVIHAGKGRMPSFPNVEASGLNALLDYLKTGVEAPGAVRATAVKYGDRTEIGGARVYDHNCALCHGDDMQGAPSNYPGILGVRDRLTDDQILTIIRNGKGRMPANAKLSQSDTVALFRFLNKSSAPLLPIRATMTSDKSEAESTMADPAEQPKYQFTGYKKFQDQDGYPAVVPPWGTLNAIDLNTGKYLWKIPLGEYPELAAKGLTNTGTENYGGPVVTAGGIVMIGATIFDNKIRAFDSKTGKLLWVGELPYAGNATPATYMVDGKQFIVIAASGQRNPKAQQGAAYVAFALP
jgi:mono/diheme cytochrome c family protein